LQELVNLRPFVPATGSTPALPVLPATRSELVYVDNNVVTAPVNLTVQAQLQPSGTNDANAVYAIGASSPANNVGTAVNLTVGPATTPVPEWVVPVSFLAQPGVHVKMYFSAVATTITTVTTSSSTTTTTTTAPADCFPNRANQHATVIVDVAGLPQDSTTTSGGTTTQVSTSVTLTAVAIDVDPGPNPPSTAEHVLYIGTTSFDPTFTVP
jgi:hypothetical protein